MKKGFREESDKQLRWGEEEMEIKITRMEDEWFFSITIYSGMIGIDLPYLHIDILSNKEAKKWVK